MDTLIYSIRKLVFGIPLLFLVTLISFILMVYFGPDLTYSMLGKNPTEKQIQEIRDQLGYNDPIVIRYKNYLVEMVTFDFGYSEDRGEEVLELFKRTIPISIAVAIPPFVIANLLGITLALISAFYRGGMIDRGVMFFAVLGMSISFLIVLIGFQYLFCSSFALGWFPVQGWSTDTLGDYFKYVTVPTLASVVVSLGYNTRFYRAVMVEEMGKDHIRTARAYGCSSPKLLFKHVLKNAMIPIATRIIFTIPFIVIGGSLLVEKFFSIPGFGLVLFEGIVTGDIAVVKAAVTSIAVLYVLILILVDITYQFVDPRISLK